MARHYLTALAVLHAVLVAQLAAVEPSVAGEPGTYKTAKPADPASPPSPWQFTFAPYGWMMGVDGDVTVRGHKVDVNESFIDLLEDSDSLMALMGYFEARRGPLGFFTDVVWADLSFSGRLQGQANPIANLNILVNTKADLDYELTIIQSGVAYEIANWDRGETKTALDLLASARYWNQSVDVTVDVNSTVSLGTIGFQASQGRALGRTGDLEWVDPVIGARVRHQTASGAKVDLIGDIGGFGAGSDFSWQTVATYGCDTMLFGLPLHAVVGYRALGVDYSENGPFGKNGMNAVLHGPVLGAKFRW